MTDYIRRSKITEARKAFCAELYKELFGCLDNGKERPMTKEEKAFFGYNKKFAQLINNIPAADVVEIVRCKDCKYYGVYADGLCEAWEETTKPNGYCYVGERVSEDD